MTTSPRWLSRYQQGRREQVWHELRQLGAAARTSEWAPEAQLVCDEMAHRARQNGVFREGGFPWPSGDDAQWSVRRRLARDLLPL